MSETNLEKNEYYKRLKKRMDQIYVGEGEDRRTMKLPDLLDLINMDDRSFRETHGFKQDKIKNKEYQRVFKRVLIRALYLACQINPADFLLDEKQEAAWLNKFDKDRKHLYFTHKYWDKITGHFKTANALIEYIPFDTEETGNNQSLNDGYEHIAVEYFAKAKQSINVYEVLFKGDNTHPNEYPAYATAQNQVLTAIKKWLDTKKAENERRAQADPPLPPLPYHYTRTLAVSRSTSLFPKSGDDNLMQAMVLEASQKMLEHIQEIMDEHAGHYSFYVTRTSWLRNHALIDNTRLTEDYVVHNKFIKNEPRAIVVPQGIFVNDASPTSKAFAFKKSLEGDYSGLKINKSTLRESLKEACKYVEEQVINRLDVATAIEDTITGLQTSDLIKRERDIAAILKRYNSTIRAKMISLGYELE